MLLYGLCNFASKKLQNFPNNCHSNLTQSLLLSACTVVAHLLLWWWSLQAPKAAGSIGESRQLDTQPGWVPGPAMPFRPCHLGPGGWTLDKSPAEPEFFYMIPASEGSVQTV